MNKRILSLLLCFIMMFSMLATAVSTYDASVESTTITVAPNKTTANPGDIITYTITLGPVSDMGTMQMELVIPTGLTYVANSGKLADGLKAKLGFDDVAFTEVSLVINGVASTADYESAMDTEIATFQCKVNDDFTGTTSLGLTYLEFYSCQTWEDHTSRFTVEEGVVLVEPKPVAVAGVTIDETLSVKTGESKTPSWTISPADATNKTVSFKSNNPDIAAVNETTGEVTGVKEGTATITITTAEGNFTDTCVVTVECSHANKTSVAEKASDCKNRGWDAYVKCDDCGQLFKADGTTEIAEIPFRALSDEHTGGSATCTAQAVCSVCGNPYGGTLDHRYTAETKKAEALKTAGNCRDKAVYWYSCSACGDVECDDSHTFLGDKVASTHVGGTTLINQAEANHDTQTDGYTGDTQCQGCGEIIDYGQNIPAGEHTPAGEWSTDSEYHWKECNVVGCGVVIDGSKVAHSSEKAENKAACEKQAVCDVCGVAYGEIPQHNYGDEKLEQPAEIGKTGLMAHYQCSECQKYFVDEYLDTHIAKKEVSYEELIIPALIDEEYTIEIPFSVIVEKTGDLDPEKETFTFEIFDLGYEDTIFTVEGLAVETNGVNAYTGKLVIKVKESQLANLSEGFKFAQVKGTTDGWTYDETTYYIALQMSNNGYIDFIIFPGDDAWGNTTLEKVEFTNSYNKAQEPVQPDDNEDNRPTEIPNTGDNSMMLFWYTMLCISGIGLIVTSVLGKKRFVR